MSSGATRTFGGTPVLSGVLAAVCTVLAPTQTDAWSGGGHRWATHAATRMFGAGQGPLPGDRPLELLRPCLQPGEAGYRMWADALRPGGDPYPGGLMVLTYEDVCRNPLLGVPIMPELGLVRQWHRADEDCIFTACDGYTLLEDRYLWDWLLQGSYQMDYANGEYLTINHFWFSEEGLHECPNDTLANDNAWERVEEMWVRAIDFWNGGPGVPPNLGAAYTVLGYALHLVQDMGQPAHSNEDMHGPGNRDSLEEWMYEQYCEDNFREWKDIYPAAQDVGPFFPPPLLKGIGQLRANVPHHWLNDGEVMQSLNEWEYIDEVIEDNYFILPELINHYRIPQLFEVMYLMNQIGSFFASDDENGNLEEPLSWLDNYGSPWYGFPLGPWLYDVEAGAYVPAWNADGLDGGSDNDGCSCNWKDNDLSQRIFPWTYGAAFNATKFFLNLFREVVDRNPPTSTCFIMVKNTQVPSGTWVNEQARVFMPRDGVVDNANLGFRPSGVWMLWGLVDGAWAQQSDESGLAWTITTEGDHLVQLMSTDLMGNVEQTDLHVKLDFTPPLIQSPAMRPVFDFSRQRDLVVAWTASDALSGVASTSAWLDGRPVANGQEISPNVLGAGRHTLSVSASDLAGNRAVVEYAFDVVFNYGCGSGSREAGEACDDGNAADGDGCDSNCTVTACGNGITTPATGERCDGSANCTSECACASGYTPDWNGFCLPVVCGNSWREGDEACDDGNSSDGDGCSSACQVESGYTCEFFVARDFCKTTCGDGVWAGKEACDDGNLSSGDGCDADCSVSACGNDIVAGAETCEDGNAVDGDGCDANCTATACGNGVMTAGEACDDGNLSSGDGCDANCTLTGCGNGIVTEDEACDDGNPVSGDGCDWDCSFSFCGADPDNDTRWTATPFGGCGLTAGTIDCRTDVDFYSFIAPSTGTFSFATTPAGLALVSLYDTSGNALDEGLTNVSRKLAADEKLVVRVKAADQDSTFGYGLEIARRGSLRRVIPQQDPGGGS